MGSHFHGVWGDPSVGSLILASITTHKEADSKRPTKKKSKQESEMRVENKGIREDNDN